MAAEVANEVKVRLEAALVEQAIGVATHRQSPARFEDMVVVQGEAIGVLRQRAAIDHGLAVVFASLLQAVDFEQPIGG